MENNTVISIQNLVKRFPVGGDFFTALKNVDLDLYKESLQVLLAHRARGKQPY